jgi:uncharacterized membrane protein HdeD (DUF308 family)
MSDNSLHISNLIRGISTTAILSGLLAAVLGVVILEWSQPSVVAAAVLFGVYLVASGVALVFLAFSLPLSGGSRFVFHQRRGVGHPRGLGVPSLR